ncbi:Protein of unknown function [Sanguibacter gelidistatuariae]|uniref:DUF3710 domain-containing protein n=1 Tax=Sanguibacter gelidistatuariae TaxID=1814289 RepID=A0A1G6RHB0_9MICO|nr:DUF3710 domain-containing protein [Sanguibacter gelidistatuariae]SDD04039.1 Protein of unknown function [Sanguibacter gelidistatuariae]
MALFRRGSKETPAPTQDSGADSESSTSVEAVEPVEAAESADQAAATVHVVEAYESGVGPWDVSEVPDIGKRIDLGALRIPGIQGMELRMEVDQKTNRVTGTGLSVDGSALQVQAFAAPRTDGIWDEIRAEIAESIVKQGGSVDDVPGPFGRELLARLPARTPDGRTGHRPARFIGHDGPRWFLRGVISGKAAVDVEAAKTLEEIFGQIVVVRGDDARPPRDLLVLTLPTSAVTPAADGADADATAADAAPNPTGPEFDPLTRGPEITEIH